MQQPPQNRSTLQQLLPILNLPCGDVLKAHLLAHFHPDIPKLNPMWLQGQSAGPRGQAEAAAAATREAIKGLPPADKLAAVTRKAAAQEVLEAVVADHKPPMVKAEPGKTYTLEQPVVVSITSKGSAGAVSGGGAKRFTSEAIKSQIAEAKAASVPQAPDEEASSEDPQVFVIDGVEWVTIKEAGRRLGLNPSNVYVQICNSKRSHYAVESKPAPQAKHPATKVYKWVHVQRALSSKLKPVDK